MTFNPLMIAPINQGIREDIDSWMIPEDAFTELQNCFIYQGRVTKKPGYSKLGRLQKQVADEVVGAAPGPSYSGSLSQTDIVPGTLVITDGTKTATDSGFGTFTGDITTGTINYLTGAYAVTFDGVAVAGVTADFDWYPLSPVMGLATYEITDINYENLIAFDQTSSYEYDNALGKFVHLDGEAVAGDSVWSSNDSQFFSYCNYWHSSALAPLLWVVNSKAQSVQSDGIKFYDDSVWTTTRPIINASTHYLEGAKIIIPYKNRLVVFNTWENDGTSKSYPNRMRWSQNGTPLIATDAEAWREDIIGKGGYLDASTNEAITAVRFYFGNLIVYFEKSTWLVKFTGEDLLPFRFEKISNEFGNEGINCPVVMDAGGFQIGDKRISYYDGSKLQEADGQIPRFVFKEINNDNGATERLAGMRDLFHDLIYWAYPSSAQDRTYPDRVLVLDPKTGAFSKWNESFTCFGFYQSNDDITWQEATFAWDATSRTWRGSGQSRIPEIIAGNQNGFVLQLDKEKLINDPCLPVTDVTVATKTLTIPNHNLEVGQFIMVKNSLGITGLNDYSVRISDITDSNNVVVEALTLAGTYIGAGEAIMVSNVSVKTKRFNMLKDMGSQTRISYIDVLLDRTTAGEMTFDLFLDAEVSTPSVSRIMPTYHESGPDGDYQWHRLLVNSTAQTLQLKIYMSDDQMEDETIAASEFVVHGMIIWVKGAGRTISI